MRGCQKGAREAMALSGRVWGALVNGVGSRDGCGRAKAESTSWGGGFLRFWVVGKREAHWLLGAEASGLCRANGKRRASQGGAQRNVP